MKYSITTQHIELSEADLTLLDKKLERIKKYLTPPFNANVVLRHDTHHRTGITVTCTVNIKQGKTVFHAQRAGESIQEALDEVIDVLKRELLKNQDKHK